MTDLENLDGSNSLTIVDGNFQTISIYLLCTRKHDEEYTIQASFGKNLKYDFKPIDRFQSESKSEIVLYRLDYDMAILDKATNVHQSNIYHLEKIFSARNLSGNYEDSKQRVIDINQPSIFLFDVHFQSKFPLIHKGRMEEFWTQLCFYTFFLMKNQLTDRISWMIEQFKSEFQLDQTRKLTEHALNTFFYTCFTYFPNISLFLARDSNMLKIFLQMFGQLPIEKVNFKTDNRSLNELASEIYEYIRQHLQQLLQITNQQDWNDISRGLTIFMCAQLLGNETTFNTFSLFEQMKEFHEKQEMTANCLVKRLIDLHTSIQNNSWTKLFTLVTDKHLLINCLDLVTSLEDYLIVLQYVIKDDSINESMKKQLTTHFDRFINQTDVTLSLEQINCLLTYLQPNYQSQTFSSQETLRTFQSIIKSSTSLPLKIHICLENLDMNKLSLETLRQLFQLNHSVSIFKFDQMNYLIRILNNYPNRTSQFYITWFRCFLCEKNNEHTKEEHDKFKQLVKTWFNCFQHDFNILVQIIEKLDSLFEHLQSTVTNENVDLRMDIFQHHLLIICFEPNSIYRILVEICTKVTNKPFIHLYQKKFITALLENNRNNLKSMEDPNNPLYQLLRISKTEHVNNRDLIGHLIAACAKLIQLNNEEIRYETFVHPSKKTLTYTILFDEHFTDYSLVIGTIKQLDVLWNRWVQTGITLSDLEIWQEHTRDEREVFTLIWEKVRNHFKKKQSIDVEFKEAEIEYRKKEEYHYAMMTTLNLYCDRAMDYSSAMNSVRDMLQELKEKPIRSVKTPTDLQIIEVIVEQLHPLSKCRVWLNYYQQRTINRSNPSVVNLSENSLERKHSQSSQSSRALINSKSFHSESDDEKQTSGKVASMSSSMEARLNTSRVPRSRKNSSFTPKMTFTSVDILNNVQKIYGEFRHEIIHICEHWKEEPIHQWIKFFIDNDENLQSECEILSKHLHLRIPQELIDILTLWNTENLTFIRHVCQGCLNLTVRLNITIKNEDYDVLKTLVKLNDEILGEKCSSIYQTYLQNYVHPYSPNTRTVWSQYSIASELIDFIVGMNSSDFENLLENVNDWGTKLVGGKTVRDYQLLKHYFDQVYKSIEELRADKRRFTLPNIFQCFNHVDLSDQIGNLEDLFNTCSTELPNMRQSHAELTDKELSKRKLILNIMLESSVRFIQSNEFNILLSVKEMKFGDLNELRDRARLIEYSYRNRMRDDDQYQIEQMEIFIQFVDTIEVILNTLTGLYIAGYPMMSEILQLNEEFLCRESQYETLKNFRRMIEEISLNWEKTLCEKYILYPELTYFSCRQFDMLEQFIIHPSECQEEEYGYHLLKYIGLNPIVTHQIQTINSSKSTAEERLEYLGQILSEQRLPSNGLTAINQKQHEILLIEFENHEILRTILSLFKRVKCIPTVNHLFFCTNETTWMEIRGFVYRCVYSREFHQLIRPECLSRSIQDRMMDLIRQLLEDNPEQFVCFAILIDKSKSNQQLIENLKSLQILHILHDENFIDDIEFHRILSDLIRQCTLVTSRIVGLGKTHTIIEQCRRLHKDYIKFPMNGNIQSDFLAKRLLKQAREFPRSVIHFDLGLIDNPNQINDLINCLVLFRSFSFGQIAISIPQETPIFIELDSSTHSKLLQDIHLFKYISTINIDQIRWKSLIPNDAVRFVVNYLEAIQNRTITTKDLNVEQMIDIPVARCVVLIKEFFFYNQTNEFITWNKVFICISIFYRLFLGFSRCSYFQCKLLEDKRLRQSRMDILQAFLNSANQFTSNSVESVRRRQNERSSNRTDRLSQELTNAIIRWDQMQPFTLIFSPSDCPIFVYKTERDVPVSLKNYFDLYNRQFDTRSFFQRRFSPLKPDKPFFPDYNQLTHEEFFEKLVELSGNKYQTKAICTRCFRQYEYDTLLCEYCVDVSDPLDKPFKIVDEQERNAFRKRIARIIESEYVLTADNFIKMLLVFLRVQSGVPVLIMGETGCGKTALINCLCQKILDDDLHVFRLHAGVTNEKLLEEMQQLIIQAERLTDEKRLWIFFDEFNTIFNISLLKEIICERTMLGKPLPKQMVFLGTCNPRRYQSEKPIYNENVGLKKDRYGTLKLRDDQRNLLYTVSHIPETMLEYIWDYGHLDQETEKTYIAAALKTCHGFDDQPTLLRVVIDLISESHRFLRELEDISSVSLRDVARFCRLYKWFRQYLDQSSMSPKQLTKDASLLTLLLCYYFRLDTTTKKNRYLERLDKYLCAVYEKTFSTYSNYIQEILTREQDRLLKQLRIPDDMAYNRALKDNLFVLFSCIINHIPVFLCGKPGASKTSAVQILMNNLKGLRSDQSAFRKLPELVAVAFQGSQSCTSKDIEQVFERAKQFMDIKSNSPPLLPVIIFDEIGLAELSPQNPLKVLHEHLEMEECRFGFVGISNWRLDASKMNRALYIACLDPSDTDLQTTGVFLSKKSLRSNLENAIDENIIRGLAQAYWDLQERMSKIPSSENYFGLRDYYSLIKGIVRDCQKYPQRSQYEIIYQQLVYNFGGINNGYEYMWKKFCFLLDRFDLLKIFETPNPKQLIDKCLTNRNSRHLMLIVDRESTIDHVERYITSNHQRTGTVKTLVGSQFEGDLLPNGIYTESYSTRILMEIILYAETPITLVMRRMNHLYDSLYDLFNQNFAMSGRKKYCRIALSAIYNPRCFVHDQFYCVILLNALDVDMSDPPFLNRFEKHYISIDKLTQTRAWSLTCQLLDWTLKLPISNVNKQFFSLKNFILPYSPDYICDLVIDTYQDDDWTDEMILNSCKSKLIRACSFDFVLVLSLTNQHEDLIEQYYQIHENLFNISQLLTLTFEQTHPTKRLIYTYTSIYESIDYPNDKYQIQELKLNSIKTELELTNHLRNYSQKKTSSSILLIRIDYHHEKQHILSLKYNLLNQWSQLESSHIWLIFHLQRNTLNELTNDVLFHGWDMIMIENLNNFNEFISKDILLHSSYEYFLQHYPIDFLEENFNEYLHRTLSKFRYENLSYEQKNRRYQLLFDTLNHDEYFRRIIFETIKYFIRTIPNEIHLKDWREDLLTNQYISLKSRTFHEALQSIIHIFYECYLKLFIHHFEQFDLLNSYFYLRENPSEQLKTIWEKIYRSSLTNIDRSLMNIDIIEIHLIDHLRLPNAMKEYENLKHIRNILSDILDEDDHEVLIKKLLKEKTSYGEELFIDEFFFESYYHDQLILFHMEKKFHLSIEFTLELFLKNSSRRTIDRFIQLILNIDVLEEILRFFEDGFKLYDENLFLKHMNKQLITLQTLNQLPSIFYSIIYRNNRMQLIPPQCLNVDEQYEFDSFVDPFIEINLLNLIECLISMKLIQQIQQLEQITSIFSSINQRVLKLPPYEVRNRERLSSFMSLLRTIQTLNPTETLKIFQISCKDLQFDGNFRTADEIDYFIRNLERVIVQQPGCEFDRRDVRNILLKLEIEFLKNWLVDHSEQHFHVLQLINQTDNHLWKYSAKIFSYIVGKLDLLTNIEWSHQSTNNTQLDEHLNLIDTSSNYTIHRLFVNRIYLDLILRTPLDQKSIQDYLNTHYLNFEKSIQCISISPSSDTQLILVLSWLKFYCHLYALAFVHNLRFRSWDNLDQFLTNNSTSFYMTIKFFLLKQILNLSKMDFNTFQKQIDTYEIKWLPEFFNQFPEENHRIERSLILPVPLIELKDEYTHVNHILSDYTDDHALERLILSCSTDQYRCYCFYLWFIKYYSQFAQRNFHSNDHYRNYFSRKLSNESKIFLQPIGIEFLQMLSTNFTPDSYFRLDSSMSDQMIAFRLIILNVFALIFSFKSFNRPNWISTLLFDQHFRMPTNYYEHLQKLCLFGLIDLDPIKTNMKFVRRSIQQRLKAGHLTTAGRFMYQCSKDCLYLYHFTHCGIPNEKSRCPFCKKEIGAAKYGQLIVRDPPQIVMSLNEGLQFIEQYIDRSNREDKFGYYQVTQPEHSTLDQRPDYLKNPLTYRFLHFFLHSILMILKEFKYLSNDDLDRWNITSDSYFIEHLEKDYQLLTKSLPDHEYAYVWIFQMLNCMLNGFEDPHGALDVREKTINLEIFLERHLINPHSQTKMNDINQYKQTYLRFTEQETLSNTLTSFIDERTENHRRYPYLNFFNITPIFHGNPIEEFHNHLQMLPHAKVNYPLTMFILERIDLWNNIQQLFPIIQFLNYLREKYNYRISRQQAVSKSLDECLDDRGNDFFEKFILAWSKINLTEVRYGCQVRRFDRQMNREKKLAFFSLNVSQDDSSLILAAVLQTIAKIQNELVNYFHQDILQTNSIRHLPIHVIENKHILHFDQEYLRNKIIKHALVINYIYGQSKEIFYDYEEIEMTFRSLISSLPLIDTDKFRKIQYQFELYAENNALINAVRQHIQQKQLDENLQEQYRRILHKKDENELLQYLSSIDYIFTYMQNRNYRTAISNIKQFVQEYIRLDSFTEQNAFLRSSFASIRLEYIIDLYELIEEIAFDRIFRQHMEDKLHGQTMDINERITIQKKFLSLTIDNPKLASNLRQISVWISTLKRFMVRILPDYLDVHTPIEIYLKRNDLWNGQITEEDIETIQLDQCILLKHVFILLIGLENRMNNRENDLSLTNRTIITNEDDVTGSFKPSLKQINVADRKRYRDS